MYRQSTESQSTKKDYASNTDTIKKTLTMGGQITCRNFSYPIVYNNMRKKYIGLPNIRKRSLKYIPASYFRSIGYKSKPEALNMISRYGITHINNIEDLFGLS